MEKVMLMHGIAAALKAGWSRVLGCGRSSMFVIVADRVGLGVISR
jgi:hypothetical protein